LAHRTRIILIVALQLLALAGVAGAKQWELMTGTVIQLETAPVDPRDLFRGDYVVLNYRISTLEPAKLRSSYIARVYPGSTVYVGLEQRGQFWEAVSLDDISPPAGLFIKGTVRERTGQPTFRVEYGIESYFVPEGTGRRIEAARKPLTVEVAVTSRGTAIIRRVMMDGQPIP
jgi:uncharacterized membrane-anchored protein